MKESTISSYHEYESVCEKNDKHESYISHLEYTIQLITNLKLFLDDIQLTKIADANISDNSKHVLSDFVHLFHRTSNEVNNAQIGVSRAIQDVLFKLNFEKISANDTKKKLLQKKSILEKKKRECKPNDCPSIIIQLNNLLGYIQENADKLKLIEESIREINLVASNNRPDVINELRIALDTKLKKYTQLHDDVVKTMEKVAANVAHQAETQATQDKSTDDFNQWRRSCLSHINDVLENYRSYIDSTTQIDKLDMLHKTIVLIDNINETIMRPTSSLLASHTIDINRCDHNNKLFMDYYSKLFAELRTRTSNIDVIIGCELCIYAFDFLRMGLTSFSLQGYTPRRLLDKYAVEHILSQDVFSVNKMFLVGSYNEAVRVSDGTHMAVSYNLSYRSAHHSTIAHNFHKIKVINIHAREPVYDASYKYIIEQIGINYQDDFIIIGDFNLLLHGDEFSITARNKITLERSHELLTVLRNIYGSQVLDHTHRITNFYRDMNHKCFSQKTNAVMIFGKLSHYKFELEPIYDCALNFKPSSHYLLQFKLTMMDNLYS